jgi:curved DNA-binding protein CbpA
VAVKTHYEQLELGAAATAGEIKQSFRALIARYHPDKVQHLGKEFQDMAADRAAELTEAYRILSDATRRAEYDRTLNGPAAQAVAAAAASPKPSAATAPPAPATVDERVPPPPSADDDVQTPNAFREERATRDEYMRKATLSRLKHAVDAIGGGYDEAQLRGFEIALVAKSKLFGRNKNPRLLGRFLSRVDGPAVVDTWVQAAKWTTDDVCVFLLGSSLASARELATAIAEQRRRSKSKVTLIPIDARDWTAHVPTDAPDVAKALVARLKGGT